MPISRHRGAEVMGKEAWKQITLNKMCMADLKRIQKFQNEIFATYFFNFIICMSYFATTTLVLKKTGNI